MNKFHIYTPFGRYNSSSQSGYAVMSELLEGVALVANNMVSLQKLKPQHKGIFYNDFNFDRLTSNQILSLLTVDEDQLFNGADGVPIKRSKDLLTIFTVNHTTFPRLKAEFEHERISRRALLVDLDKELAGGQFISQLALDRMKSEGSNVAEIEAAIRAHNRSQIEVEVF